MQNIDKPYRVATFRTVAAADRAIRSLLAAGFSHDELAVVCSDKHKEELLPDVKTPRPDDSYPATAIGIGSAIGATLGGLALVASAFVTGGATLVTTGPVLVGGGAIGGAFAGAMSTRGLEGELGAYYEQAVRLGQILVAVDLTKEPNTERRAERLAKAERLLAEVGAEPVALTEAKAGTA